MGSFTLVQLCIKKVAPNMDVLESQAKDLPAILLKELMPHLSLYYLDRMEKAAQLKGVSCTSAWVAKWRALNRTLRWRLKDPPIDSKFLQPEKEDWKQMCFESYFHSVLFRRSQAQSSSFDMTELSVAAKYVQVLSLFTLHDVQRLASKELRPILATLEKGVRTLRLLDARVLLRYVKPELLLVLHRLLDHGSVIKLVLKRASDSHIFRWVVSRCKGSSWIDEGTTASKIPRLELHEIEYNNLSTSCCTNVICPMGQIHSLDLELCSLSTVFRLLPSWLGLRSLHLCTTQLDCRKDVVEFVECLRKLFLNPHCSLRDLSLGNMYVQGHLASLLMSCPTLHTLSLEISLWWDSSSTTSSVYFTPNMQLSLEKLTLKAVENQTTVECLPAILQHAPNLSTLRIIGIRHAHSLLRTLPESNPSLKVLLLEDINLADCHCEIFSLLENSRLEELSLKDCRLLEKCTKKNDFLVSFVASAKKLHSLCSLSLSQNRLSSGVVEVADLFLENPGNITKLDLSSNFILSADLLEFSRRIEAYLPSHRFTLDLRFNPLSRDPVLRGQALQILLPFCEVLTDEWDFRSDMVDHVSVM